MQKFIIRQHSELERFFPAELMFSNEAKSLNYPQRKPVYPESKVLKQTKMCVCVCEKSSSTTLELKKTESNRIEHSLSNLMQFILKAAP